MRTNEKKCKKKILSKKNRKKIIIGVIIIAVVGSGGIIFWKVRSDKNSRMVKRQNTVKVSKMDLTKSISATGTIISSNSKSVSASINDVKVKKMNVKVGDKVKKGQSLVAFDESDLKEALSNAKQDYSDTVSSCNRSETSASNKLTELKNSDKATDSSIEQAQNELADVKSKNKKELREAKEKVTKASNDVNNCAVTAPISGTVVSVGASSGDTYTGGTLVQIEDTSSFYISTSVDEYNISDVKVGQKAVVLTDATDDDELTGKITFVAPSMSSTSSNSSSSNSDSKNGSSMDVKSSTSSSSDGYEVKIKLDKTDDRLRLDMTAKCSIVLKEAKDVLAVPYDAINEHHDGTYTITVIDESDSDDSDSKNVDNNNDNDGRNSEDATKKDNKDGVVDNKNAENDTKEKKDFKKDKDGFDKDKFDKKDFEKGDFSKGDFDKKKNGGASSNDTDRPTKEIVVKKGLESDYYVEVSGDELKEGMEVVIPSDEVETNSKDSSKKDNSSPFGGFGGGPGGFGGGPGGFSGGSGLGRNGGSKGSGGSGKMAPGR